MEFPGVFRERIIHTYDISTLNTTFVGEREAVMDIYKIKSTKCFQWMNRQTITFQYAVQLLKVIST